MVTYANVTNMQFYSVPNQKRLGMYTGGIHFPSEWRQERRMTCARDTDALVLLVSGQVAPQDIDALRAFRDDYAWGCDSVLVYDAENSAMHLKLDETKAFRDLSDHDVLGLLSDMYKENQFHRQMYDKTAKAKMLSKSFVEKRSSELTEIDLDVCLSLTKSASLERAPDVFLNPSV